ncbi:MAG TPA: RNA polymerase sigma factor region1.1 domain-containing protein, partial [Burkholderiaceae bacterium]|nr:RNA polymerase sigma factor region1.1 domain-containing protein [Burkholderiaceae bacterium]
MTAKKSADTAKTTAAAKTAAEKPVVEKKAVSAAAAKAAVKAPAAKAAPAAKTAATKTATAAKGAKAAAKTAAPEPKGKKGKKDEAAKPTFEDDADVEADLEGDVEADGVEEVAEDAGEVKAKAKPLRMKVSRAKERALMREFGLDETQLTEEEVAKRRHELKTLIKMGKTRGFLTHQEINDHLPEKLVDNEILEAIVSMLNDMGIAVYEQAPDAATLLISGQTQSGATEEEAEEAAEAALSTVDSEFGRTTDPVRMYMREMGASELLTRAGEIEIAKRIEGGLQDMVQAIAMCPSIIATILSDVDRVVAGEIRIDELVDGISNPNESAE